MVFFTITILVLLLYVAIKTAIKIANKEQEKESRQFESKEAERILRERRRQQQEEQDRQADSETGGFTSRSYSSQSNAGCEKKTYQVAGISFREDAVLSLAMENSEYDLSKKEIVEAGSEGERIWKYDFDPVRVSLIPEPDNRQDANAIKVIVDGEHIGYIKSDSCSHVKKLLEEGRIVRIKCEMGGGPYKIVQEDYDDDKDKTVYTVEKDSTNYFAKLIITERE